MKRNVSAQMGNKIIKLKEVQCMHVIILSLHYYHVSKRSSQNDTNFYEIALATRTVILPKT